MTDALAWSSIVMPIPPGRKRKAAGPMTGTLPSARGTDLGKVGLRDEAQGPWAPGMFLVGSLVKRWPPRPRDSAGEIGHAADATGPYRSVHTLFDGTRLEDDGVSRCGCQARRPLSEPSLSEHSFQLLACRPHRVAPFRGGRCIDGPEFLSAGGGSHAAEPPLLAHKVSGCSSGNRAVFGHKFPR
jgi:hypothetical protein